MSTSPFVEVGPSSVLRDRADAHWSVAVEHPMVVEIRDGTLPLSTFRRYFEQNIQYLEDYTRALGYCLGMAPDRETIEILSTVIHQLAEVELPANESFLHRAGGSSPVTAAMDPVTRGYTDHLLESARSGDLAVALAAVMPCEWSYGELAIAPAHPGVAIYEDWLAIFAADSYHDMMATTAGLFDRVVAASGRTSLDDLAAVFDRSSEWEVRFWDLAYYGSDGPPSS